MKQDKPSTTALLIAKSQLLLAEDPSLAKLVDDARIHYYRSFVEAATSGPFHLNAISRLWLKLTERFSVPGMYLHFALRKKCIEHITRSFIDRGEIEQIVVIAAGFDPLMALIASKHEELACFELDHPATQQAKKKGLATSGMPKNLKLIPVDLTRQTVFAALSDSSFSPEKPTLFIAEGITMYLTDTEIGTFFAHIKSCASHKYSHLLFTYMNKQSSGSIQFEDASVMVTVWLRLKREMFKWGIANGDLAGFLATMGYQLVNMFDSKYLAAHFLTSEKTANLPLARGENICLARVQ